MGECQARPPIGKDVDPPGNVIVAHYLDDFLVCCSFLPRVELFLNQV
jgi:hypothetical protein